MKSNLGENLVRYLLLPMVGASCVILVWAVVSSSFVESLPSPAKTWEISKPYILSPFEKRGELDQGILRFTWYSLVRVAKGYVLAIALGTPIGLLLGMSKGFTDTFDREDWDEYCLAFARDVPTPVPSAWGGAGVR